MYNKAPHNFAQAQNLSRTQHFLGLAPASPNSAGAVLEVLRLAAAPTCSGSRSPHTPTAPTTLIRPPAIHPGARAHARVCQAHHTQPSI